MIHANKFTRVDKQQIESMAQQSTGAGKSLMAALIGMIYVRVRVRVQNCATKFSFNFLSFSMSNSFNFVKSFHFDFCSKQY